MTNQETVDGIEAAPSETPARPKRGNLLAWLAMAAILAAEFALFITTAEREVTWFIPTCYDQCAYLTTSYHVHEHMKQHGVLSGVEFGVGLPMPTGSLLQVLATLLFLITGPSRLAALSINFVLYAAFQCGLVGTLAWYTRRWSIGFLGLGLLLAAVTPFGWAGSLFDFRLDFGAFCLYGLFACAMVRSRFLASRRWSLVVGLAAVTLTLFRHITIVYLTGVFGICLVFILGRLLWNLSNPDWRRLALRQLTGGLLAGTILAGLVTPVLLKKQEALWNYYVVGHFLGDEKKVREAEVGVQSRLESYMFYIRSVDFHAGQLFLVFAGVCVLGGLILLLIARRSPTQASAPRGDGMMAFVFFGACLLVPYTVLTCDIAKSIIVGNVLVMPLVWLALLPALALARRSFKGRILPGTLAMFALAGMVCGTVVQIRCYRQETFWSQHYDDSLQILAVHDDIVRRSLDAGLQRPLVSCDCILEFLVTPVTTIRAFEQHGKLLPCAQTVGINVMMIDDKAIIDSVQQSDFVLLSTASVYRCDAYPFHQRMKELRPQLSEYCERQLVHVHSYHILDTTLDLYVRPAVATAVGGTNQTGSKP